MTTAALINTCPACGAEEALDSLLHRMLDDDQVRRLVADLLTTSLPVGGLVVRYLRLHKPPKQKLRMARVHQLLAELVPGIVAGRINRKGREWLAPLPAWQAAFEAVFDAQTKGTLTLPLEGNGYLYEVLMRQADRAEAEAEKAQHQAARHRSALPAGPASVNDVLQEVARVIGDATPAAPAHTSAIQAPQPGTSHTVRRFKAEIEARKARDTQQDQPTQEDPQS